jgi:hypothetical protein
VRREVISSVRHLLGYPGFSGAARVCSAGPIEASGQVKVDPPVPVGGVVTATSPTSGSTVLHLIGHYLLLRGYGRIVHGGLTLARIWEVQAIQSIISIALSRSLIGKGTTLRIEAAHKQICLAKTKLVSRSVLLTKLDAFFLKD